MRARVKLIEIRDGDTISVLCDAVLVAEGEATVGVNANHHRAVTLSDNPRMKWTQFHPVEYWRVEP